MSTKADHAPTKIQLDGGAAVQSMPQHDIPAPPEGVMLPLPGLCCGNCAAFEAIPGGADPRGGRVGYCHATPGQAHLVTGVIAGDTRQRVVSSFVTRWEWEWCWNMPQVNQMAMAVAEHGFPLARMTAKPVN